MGSVFLNGFVSARRAETKATLSSLCHENQQNTGVTLSDKRVYRDGGG